MKLRLVDDWRNGWRFYSTWAFALLLAAPDAYSGLQALGLLDAPGIPLAFANLVRGLAVLGTLARFVRQQKPEDRA